MAKPRDKEVVAGRWRIVEASAWDQDALDLVVPAHVTVGRNGLGELQLIAIDASIDYRVDPVPTGRPSRFSWSGFDDGTPASGRAAAKVDGDTMRGKLFSHQGDDSTFVARPEPRGQETSESGKAVTTAGRDTKSATRSPGTSAPGRRLERASSTAASE
jgi:hypothetical protein